MPRITPVAGKSDVPAEHHAVVDAVVKVFGGVRGPFSMLLHSPKLAERMLPLVTFFRDDSVVDAKLRSIAILSAVREREAAYVWAAQVAAARRNGLREEVIDLIRAKGDPGKLSAEEREIVIYVRQLMRTNRTDQAVFDALQKRYGVQWLVELTAAMRGPKPPTMIGGGGSGRRNPDSPDQSRRITSIASTTRRARASSRSTACPSTACSTAYGVRRLPPAPSPRSNRPPETA